MASSMSFAAKEGLTLIPSILYSPEEENYIDSTVDHYYYIYNNLISKEHIKKEQKNINTFKISAEKNSTIFG